MVAVRAQGQQTSWVYAWVGNKAAWLKLGSSLAIVGDTLEVRLPAPPPPAPVLRRVVGQQLVRVEGGWAAPAGAIDLEIHVNGIHYWLSYDYIVAAGVIVPLAENMPADADVRASFSVQQ